MLDLIAADTQGNPFIDQAAIARGRGAAVSMLQRAVVVTASQDETRVNVEGGAGDDAELAEPGDGARERPGGDGHTMPPWMMTGGRSC